jgi:hypothetical protein
MEDEQRDATTKRSFREAISQFSLRSKLKDSDSHEEAARRSATSQKHKVRRRNFTYTLATRRNCSSRFLGRRLVAVYLGVMTWFVQ